MRSATADTEEDDRDARRSERSERFPEDMKQRVEATETTLSIHTADVGTIKSQSHEIYIKLKKTDADHQELIQKLGRTFDDWNSKIVLIEQNTVRIENNFQPLMELFSSRIDKPETDFAALMSSHVSAPRLRTTTPPTSTHHDIGSPALATPPTDAHWNPLNPQRYESYGH